MFAPPRFASSPRAALRRVRDDIAKSDGKRRGILESVRISLDCSGLAHWSMRSHIYKQFVIDLWVSPDGSSGHFNVAGNIRVKETDVILRNFFISSSEYLNIEAAYMAGREHGERWCNSQS